ncbi:MAG: hypoxanthine phosphoribosyltransferase [Rikenellaceae bacterium]
MTEKIKICDRTFEIMIPASQIDSAVTAVAERMNRDYTDDDRVILLGVLNGSFMFLSDLVRRLNFRVEICFVKLSSYEGVASTGVVKDLIGFNCPIEGRNVVIVEDIVDTGNSIHHMLNSLNNRGAKSIKVCTLFFKPELYVGSAEIHYAAMNIGNDFIVGYGLDYNEFGRELPDIYVTRDE